MRKAILFLLLMSLCSASVGFAENVWVDEDWQQVKQEIDCDGLKLVIDARVLQIQEDTMAQEYHLERLSSDFMISKGQQIDWLQLGCDTSNKGSWRMPTETFPEYAFMTKDRIYPTCLIGRLCHLSVYNIDPDYIYETNDLFTNNIDKIGMEELTDEQVRTYAENVASACGYQLGDMIRIHQIDQTDLVRESIEAVIRERTYQYSIDPEKADEYLFVDAYYPVYVNGLRLYSGDYCGTADQLEVVNMNLRMAVTSGHGIALIESVLLDPATMQATSEAQPVMNEQEAIQCIANKFSNMILPGWKQITVHQLALEYVPITGDISASKGFSLYPAWVAQFSIETDTNETMTTYGAYHAITGRPLF